MSGRFKWYGSRRRGEAGFTLIEMIAVTGVFALLSAIILANNARFGGAITLENLAYDIALSVRQAQVYGIAVQRFDTGSDFSAGYGMHFAIADPVHYELFADAVTADGLYNDGELVRSVSIRHGYAIADLCVKANQATGETCGLSELDVLFRRPEPDAYISANGNSSLLEQTFLNQSARIVVRSPRGDTADIVIEVAGQVFVE